VRARIALACAGLFLVTGAAFVAATYLLVRHSFGPTPTTSQKPTALFQTCQTAQGNGTLKRDPALYAECQYFFGATNQRNMDLHELLVWSLVGLGVATIVAGILGWAIGRRILLPSTESPPRLSERLNSISMNESASTDRTTSSNSSPTPSTTC
jgi:hypothetical protein